MKNELYKICGKCKFGFEGITKEYILNDTEHCNFCDLPYIIMELEEEVKE